MEQFKIIIEQGNDAFAHGLNGIETARILRELADRIDGLNLDGFSKPLFDYNGHKVGLAEWEY